RNDVHAGTGDSPLGYALKGIVVGIGIGKNHHLAVFFLGKVNAVIGVDLFDGSGVDAQFVFETLDEMCRQLAPLEIHQIPDEVPILIRLAQINISSQNPSTKATQYR